MQAEGKFALLIGDVSRKARTRNSYSVSLRRVNRMWLANRQPGVRVDSLQRRAWLCFIPAVVSACVAHLAPVPVVFQSQEPLHFSTTVDSAYRARWAHITDAYQLGRYDTVIASSPGMDSARAERWDMIRADIVTVERARTKGCWSMRYDECVSDAANRIATYSDDPNVKYLAGKVADSIRSADGLFSSAKEPKGNQSSRPYYVLYDQARLRHAKTGNPQVLQLLLDASAQDFVAEWATAAEGEAEYFLRVNSLAASGEEQKAWEMLDSLVRRNEIAPTM